MPRILESLFILHIGFSEGRWHAFEMIIIIAVFS
jgi:hypothetical protein